MGKPELGIKRICAGCGARFYDLHRTPIHCPKCAVVHDPQSAMKTRRSRAVPAAEKAPPKTIKEVPVAAELEEPMPGDDLEKIEGEVSEEEPDVIEDPTELGQDETDVAEVIEKVEQEEP
jgi:uncharacterized protein (TIGR02300 family)